jgi:hypothetical protein
MLKQYSRREIALMTVLALPFICFVIIRIWKPLWLFSSLIIHYPRLIIIIAVLIAILDSSVLFFIGTRKKEYYYGKMSLLVLYISYILLIYYIIISNVPDYFKDISRERLKKGRPSQSSLRNGYQKGIPILDLALYGQSDAKNFWS